MSISEPAAGGGASINPSTPMASSDVSVSHQFSFNDLDLQNASYDVGLLQQHHDTTIHVSADVDQFISNSGTFLEYISSFSVSGGSGSCGVGSGSTIANPDDVARDFGGKKRKKNTSSDLDAFLNPSNKNHPKQKEAKHPNPLVMENSSSKEEYIHMRAKRGQATNSHSLAERLRREKISERMRFLQNLVPGCNKIIGKAVMLDEIINYVQSLQSQVEFLSMKLSTVNRELNQILTNDIVGQTRYANPEVGATAMSRSNPDLLIYGNIANNCDSARLCTTTSSSIWDDELQNVVYS